jgi:prepilin-type N-terminal cleavage/methylation domain-containing protein
MTRFNACSHVRSVFDPRSLRRRGARRRGFTLVELLVVVAIIGVVVSALLPAIASARTQAQRIVCANNMRSLGLAMQMYLDENDGDFPPTSHGNPDLTSAWVYTLAPYLEDAQLVRDPNDPTRSVWRLGPVRICPRDPWATERLEAGGTSYITNDWVTVPHVGPFGDIVESKTFNSRDRLDHPHRVHLVFIGAGHRGLDATNDHAHARSWVTWADVLEDLAPARFGGDERRGVLGESDDSRTGLGGTSNYLFADMHLEHTPARDMKALIDDGVNFADPTR